MSEPVNSKYKNKKIVNNYKKHINMYSDFYQKMRSVKKPKYYQIKYEKIIQLNEGMSNKKRGKSNYVSNLTSENNHKYNSLNNKSNEICSSEIKCKKIKFRPENIIPPKTSYIQNKINPIFTKKIPDKYLIKAINISNSAPKSNDNFKYEKRNIPSNIKNKVIMNINKTYNLGEYENINPNNFNNMNKTNNNIFENDNMKMNEDMHKQNIQDVYKELKNSKIFKQIKRISAKGNQRVKDDIFPINERDIIFKKISKTDNENKILNSKKVIISINKYPIKKTIMEPMNKNKKVDKEYFETLPNTFINSGDNDINSNYFDNITINNNNNINLQYIYVDNNKLKKNDNLIESLKYSKQRREGSLFNSYTFKKDDSNRTQNIFPKEKNINKVTNFIKYEAFPGGKSFFENQRKIKYYSSNLTKNILSQKSEPKRKEILDIIKKKNNINEARNHKIYNLPSTNQVGYNYYPKYNNIRPGNYSLNNKNTLHTFSEHQNNIYSLKNYNYSISTASNMDKNDNVRSAINDPIFITKQKNQILSDTLNRSPLNMINKYFIKNNANQPILYKKETKLKTIYNNINYNNNNNENDLKNNYTIYGPSFNSYNTIDVNMKKL
jgi:hypothetical protein